jgi:hypothetical protein
MVLKVFRAVKVPRVYRVQLDLRVFKVSKGPLEPKVSKV